VRKQILRILLILSDYTPTKFPKQLETMGKASTLPKTVKDRPPKRRASSIANNSISPIANQQKKIKSTLGRQPVKPNMSKPNLANSPNITQQSGSDISNVDPTQNSQQQQQQHPVNVTSSAKPVFVQSEFLVVRNLLNNMTFASKPLMKLTVTKSVQVQCASADDKKKLIAKLVEQKFRYHTFTEPSEKPSIVALKNFFYTSCDELLKTLKEEKIPATKVTFLRDNEERPIYLVHFEKNSINIQQLAHQHKAVDCVIVKWENLDSNRKRPTQCHKCQLYGHSAQNCGYNFRCVKCDKQHEPGQCERKTRDGNPTCVGCGGPHAANSRQCPEYSKYINRMDRSRKPKQVRFTSAPAPWSQHQQPPTREFFPPLVVQHESDDEDQMEQSSVSSNPNPMLSNNARQSRSKTNKAPTAAPFAQAQAKFLQIPGITHTLYLFNQMVDELSKTSDDGTRIAIMLKYTTNPNDP
jgi:hypothetical protein